MIGQATSIDALYESLCSDLEEGVRATARALPHRLRLAPRPDVPWSAVFGHAVTLEAPLLLSEAVPGADPGASEQARRVHLFSVIDAFGTDRIADGQVTPDAALDAVLRAVRAARDRALRALGGDAALHLGRAADRATSSAIAEERAIMAAARPVSFAVYEDVSARKQSVGLVATVALAQASGASAEIVERLRRTLLGVALGLQYVDDVVDWEDDLGEGGAWAVLLSGSPRSTLGLDAVRPDVQASGVLGEMLGRSLAAYRAARAGAAELGATTLALWARAREIETETRLAGETRAPGFSLRERKLAAWAKEVLG